MEIQFDADLLSRYRGRGPRYTSYPTALQFTPALTESLYRENAIASNDSSRPLSLYVHIPFCHSLCYYCGCNKIVTRNPQRVSRYLHSLALEIDLQSTLFSADRLVRQLHLGGGTPTYLSREQMQDIDAHLRAAFALDDSEDREFSIEIDPRSIAPDDFSWLADLGFNRISLGIQDFDESVQVAVNRVQSADQVGQLVKAARRSGIESVSFDLIYGLPRQTVASFESTLERVIDLGPDRLAVYNYAHLPQRFKGQRMINDDDIPLPEIKLDILHATIMRLCDAGYEYIGMDHFALPTDELVRARKNGTLQRNFQGYSTHRDCDLIALGVSAIGSIGGTFSQNSVSTAEYEELLDRGRLPIVRGLQVDADDRLRAQVIQTLMCYDQLLFEEFRQAYGIDFRDRFGAELRRLQTLADDGLVVIDNTGISITASGRLLLRSIAMVFDRYIDPQQDDERFSKAI